MALLLPERYFKGLSSISIQHDVVGKGFTCVFLDVDNTVRSRETNAVPASVQAWLEEGRAAGLRFCLLSNSWHENVFAFARQQNMPVVAKACKPLVHGYFQACSRMGCKRSQALMVGDQILTDILGAHLAGMTAYLVQPLCDINIKSALWQRQLEARILANVQPEG